jgi:cell wall assembly regulator SMI1
MKHEWERFLNLLKLTTRNQDNYMYIVSKFRPGCTPVQIKLLEKNLGVSLPNDYKELLMICNGQEGYPGIFNYNEMLSQEEVFGEWETNTDLLNDGDFDDGLGKGDTGVKSDWWNKKWIPFTSDGSGNCICIDLDPASGGHSGQIIHFWHDDNRRQLAAKSFKEFFKISTTKFLEDIKSGKIDFK